MIQGGPDSLLERKGSWRPTFTHLNYLLSEKWSKQLLKFYQMDESLRAPSIEIVKDTAKAEIIFYEKGDPNDILTSIGSIRAFWHADSNKMEHLLFVC